MSQASFEDISSLCSLIEGWEYQVSLTLLLRYMSTGSYGVPIRIGPGCSFHGAFCVAQRGPPPKLTRMSSRYRVSRLETASKTNGQFAFEVNDAPLIKEIIHQAEKAINIPINIPLMKGPSGYH